MASKFARLANATLNFTHVLTTKTDPQTGNEIPDTIEQHQTRAYIKRSDSNYNPNLINALPIGTYRISGYTVGILPVWCQLPIDPQVPCSIDNLGKGYFCFEGKIHVVYDKITKKGQTTPIQGLFVIHGSGGTNAAANII